MNHAVDCSYSELHLSLGQLGRAQVRHTSSLQPNSATYSILRLPERSSRVSAASLSLSLPMSANASSVSSRSEPISTGLSLPRNASNDPSTSGEDITAIHAPEELTEILAANPKKLVCLMCKALGCRPCKMFARKYQRVASTYRDCIFLEVTGDETTNLRKLMIQMGVRATPTFRLYREGQCVKMHVGIDEEKLRRAVRECLREDEIGFQAEQ